MSNLFSNPATFCVITLIITFMLSNMFSLIRSDILSILILVILGGSKILTTKELFFGLSSETAITIIASSMIFTSLRRNNIHAWIASNAPRSTNTKLFFYLLLCMAPLTCVLRGTNALLLILQTLMLLHYTRKQTCNTINSLILVTIPLSTLSITCSLSLLVTHDLLNHLNCTGIILKNLIYSGILLLVVTTTIIKTRILSVIPVFLKFTEFKFYDVSVNHDHPWHGKTIKEIEQSCATKMFVTRIIYADKVAQHFPRSSIALQDPCTITCASLYPEKDIMCQQATGTTNMTILIPEHHKLIGHTYRALHLSRKYQFLLHKLIRPYIRLTHHIKDQVIKAGDVLLGIGLTHNHHSHINQDLILTSSNDQPNMKKLAWIIASICLSFILFYVFKYTVSLSLLAAAILIVLGKALPQEKTYQDIDWKTLFIIISHLAMLKACLKLNLITDVATWYTHNIHVGYSLTIWMISGLTTIFTLIFSPIETVIYLIPIGITIAPKIGWQPNNLALLISLASLNVFMKPKKIVGQLLYFYGNRLLQTPSINAILLTLLYWVTLSISVQLGWS